MEWPLKVEGKPEKCDVLEEKNMFTKGGRHRLCQLHRKAESGDDGGPSFGFSKVEATGDIFFSFFNLQKGSENLNDKKRTGVQSPALNF